MHWTRYLTVTMIFASCSLLAFAGCSKESEKAANASESQSEFAVSVKVAPVVRTAIKSTIRAVGTVRALNQAKISPKIPGKIENIFVEAGDNVKAGQTLIQLEKTDLILNVRQADAALAMAEANFSKSKTDWDRVQELLDQGIASQEQYDLARSAFQVAEASVKQAKADFALAKNQLDNADVTTLFGGVVVCRYLDIGERVSPGQPLCEVAEIDPVEVEIGVSDKRFSELQIGQSALITVDGYPDHLFEGIVKKIQPSIDPATRTFKVTIRVPNEEKLLKPGMFARGEIVLDRKESALVIPRAALLEEEGRYYVVAVRDGKAARVETKLGYRDGSLIELLDGPSEGEVVVLEGAYALAQGAPLQVSEE